jgi:hypothetical protein
VTGSFVPQTPICMHGDAVFHPSPITHHPSPITHHRRSAGA